MPTSKSKKKVNVKRKEDKLRPYRVDYFFWSEVKKDKALVRSVITRAITASGAKEDALNGLFLNADGTAQFAEGLHSYPPVTEEEKTLTILRSYRFYKKLSAEPKKKTFITIDKLLPAKKAFAVIEQIEAFKKLPPPIPLRGWGTEKNQDELPEPKFGDGAVFIPEWGPNTSVTLTEVPTDPENKLSPEAFSDTSNVAAGPIAPYVVEKLKEVADSYTFPDKPLVPTKDAVFDGFKICRWHGSAYVDPQNPDRCNALDSGSGYLNEVYKRQYPQATLPPLTGVELPLGSEFKYVPDSIINLDEAAPILSPAPTDGTELPVGDPGHVCSDKCYDIVPLIDVHLSSDPQTYSGLIGYAPTKGLGVDAVQKKPKPYFLTMGVFSGGVLAILGLLYVFFKYLAK